MAINFIDYTRVPAQKPDYSAFEEFFPNILKGYQNQENLKKTNLENEGQGYENTYNKSRAGHAEELVQALINSYNRPPGDQGFSGIVGQYEQLNRLKNQFGEDHPYYKAAEEELKIGREGRKSLSEFRDAQTENSYNRYASGISKLHHERDLIENDNDLDPIRKRQMINDIDLKIKKETTDTNTRTRGLLATNIDKTLASFNVDDLVRYAGPAGGIKKKLEQGLALSGRESEEYEKYVEAQTSVDLLTSQVRQFYGDSIQPSVREHLQSLTDPSTWVNNPRLAKKQFEQLKKILESETTTYRDALKSTDVYNAPSSNLAIPIEDQKRIILEQGMGDNNGGNINYSEQELQDISRKTGLPIDQVRSLWEGL